MRLHRPSRKLALTALASLTGLTVVPLTAVPAAAAENVQNCAVQAVNDWSNSSNGTVACFDSAWEAVAYAAGPEVDLSPWRGKYSLQYASTLPEFRAALNKGGQSRHVLNLNFDDVVAGSTATLAVWGTTKCIEDQSLVVKDLRKFADGWWNDRISGYASFNGCTGALYEHVNMDRLDYGDEGYYNLDQGRGLGKANNRASAIGAHGQLSDGAAAKACDQRQNGTQCNLTATKSIEYIPQDVRTWLIAYNCGTVPFQNRPSERKSRSSEYTFGANYSVTIASPDVKILPTVEATYGFQFGLAFGTEVVTEQTTVQDVPVGELGVIWTGAAAQKFTGTWNLYYPNGHLGKFHWTKDTSATRPLEGEELVVGSWGRKMTPTEYQECVKNGSGGVLTEAPGQ